MQDQYEEVDIITKGGNYGWSMYEGPSRLKNASAGDFEDPIFPVLGYRHSDINKEVGCAAISGGYVYRSKTDPSMEICMLRTFGQLKKIRITVGTLQQEAFLSVVLMIPLSIAAQFPIVHCLL